MHRRAHNIHGNLDRSIPTPPHTQSKNDQDIRNPVYFVWFCRDQFIQTSIFASVEPIVTSTVADVDHAKAAWDVVHNPYAKKPQTRIFSFPVYPNTLVQFLIIFIKLDLFVMNLQLLGHLYLI